MEICSTGEVALIGELLSGIESLKRMDGMKTGEVKKLQISQRDCSGKHYSYRMNHGWSFARGIR